MNIIYPLFLAAKANSQKKKGGRRGWGGWRPRIGDS